MAAELQGCTGLGQYVLKADTEIATQQSIIAPSLAVSSNRKQLARNASTIATNILAAAVLRST